MNRLTVPFVAAGHAIRAVASAAIRATGGAGSQALSLVSAYLHNLRWLIAATFLELARKGYAGNEAVYACLRFLAQSVPEPPLLAYAVGTMRGTSGAGGEHERTLLPPSHPLCRLIRQPNELQTEYEFFELTVLYLGVTGRACWWKERDRSGRPIALWPLRPDRVGPYYSGSTAAGERVLSGWSYLVPGTSDYVLLPRRDVLSFNLPDPAGESGGIVEGLGPLQVLTGRVSADNTATEFEGALLANSAMPGTVLSVKQQLRSEDDAQLIKAAFKREFGGRRRGEPMVVGGEASVTQLGFNLRQLAFPDLRALNETRIAAAFGVPAILVGLRAGLSEGIRATIEQQRELFTETTLENYWRRFEVQWTLDVAAEFATAGQELVCLFDRSQVKALAAQRTQAAAVIAEAFGRGAASLNDYRTKVLNLPAIPEGDVFLVPNTVTVTPLAELGMPSPALAPAMAPVEGPPAAAGAASTLAWPVQARGADRVSAGSNGHARHVPGA